MAPFGKGVKYSGVGGGAKQVKGIEYTEAEGKLDSGR